MGIQFLKWCSARVVLVSFRSFILFFLSIYFHFWFFFLLLSIYFIHESWNSYGRKESFLRFSVQHECYFVAKTIIIRRNGWFHLTEQINDLMKNNSFSPYIFSFVFSSSCIHSISFSLFFVWLSCWSF